MQLCCQAIDNILTEIHEMIVLNAVLIYPKKKCLIFVDLPSLFVHLGLGIVISILLWQFSSDVLLNKLFLFKGV